MSLTCHHGKSSRSPSHAAARQAACQAQERCRPHVTSAAVHSSSVSPAPPSSRTLSVSPSVRLLPQVQLGVGAAERSVRGRVGSSAALPPAIAVDCPSIPPALPGTGRRPDTRDTDRKPPGTGLSRRAPQRHLFPEFRARLRRPCHQPSALEVHLTPAEDPVSQAEAPARRDASSSSREFSNPRDTLKAPKRSHVGPDETERFFWQKQKEKNVSGGCVRRSSLVQAKEKKLGVFSKGRHAGGQGGRTARRLRGLHGRSQDSTKGFIDSTHESEWPQVNHFGFSRPLHFSKQDFLSHKGPLWTVLRGLLSCAQRGPVPSNLSAHAAPLHPLGGPQPCRRGDSHPPEHCRQRERAPPKNAV